MAMSAAKVVRTMCPMNCHPTFCGMLVEVEDGKLKAVSGDKGNPDSQGFLCCAAVAPTRFLAIDDGCSTPKFEMIAARIRGAAQLGMRRWILS
jgi:molybdopterin-dependent oxidoreductase iron-sulfur protein